MMTFFFFFIIYHFLIWSFLFNALLIWPFSLLGHFFKHPINEFIQTPLLLGQKWFSHLPTPILSWIWVWVSQMANLLMRRETPWKIHLETTPSLLRALVCCMNMVLWSQVKSEKEPIIKILYLIIIHAN